MKGNTTVVNHLNTVLKNELTAINEYFLHARMLQDQGYAGLGGHVYQESIGEMKHADRLVQRILFLEGLPNLQDLGKLRVGETPPEMLENDLALERGAREDLVAGVKLCEEQGDYVSRNLLRELLDETEEHIDWLETQLGLIEAMGRANYLQSAATERGE